MICEQIEQRTKTTLKIMYAKVIITFLAFGVISYLQKHLKRLENPDSHISRTLTSATLKDNIWSKALDVYSKLAYATFRLTTSNSVFGQRSKISQWLTKCRLFQLSYPKILLADLELQDKSLRI